MGSLGPGGLTQLTLRFSFKHPSSAGVRAFLRRHGCTKGPWARIKFDLRHGWSRDPMAYGAYDNGVQHRINLRNADADTVKKTLLKLAQRRGRKQTTFSRWHRGHNVTSVQGGWKLDLV